MKKISNSTLISIITKLFVLAILAKGISLGLYLYLPKQSQEIKLKTNYQPKYRRIDFRNILNSNTIQNTKRQNTRKSSGVNINNMILKGLYGSKTNGFIIVAMKNNPKKTNILSIGENYQGYKLKSITKNNALFTKNNKEYILSFKKIDVSSKITKLKNNTITSKEMIINRNDINYYIKDPNKIMQDISIKDIKNGKELKGFKVMKIKRNSKMAVLGLKVGDLITGVNNTKLKSYQDALKVYTNIDDLNFIKLVIIRNNEEMELEYEIN